MKSDSAVFGGYWFGIIIGAFGGIVGLLVAFVGGYPIGLVKAIISIFIGGYLVFKARRGKGNVIYYGGHYPLKFTSY